MSARVSIVKAWVIAGAAAVGLAAAGAALAGPGGGGGHAMGGGHAAVGGGFRGGVARGGFYGGYRGGYYGGYRGAWGRPYGWGGYYGWRGGWGCCGWGAWPWVGLGWYLSALPYGYTTLYYSGVPYYYANNYYYVWDSGAGQYEAVEPPPAQGTAPSRSAGVPPSSSPASNTWTDLYAYPKAGQSTEQQAKDRDECHKWAVAQTGFDPAQPTQESQSDWASKREGYLRAEGACLTARNYSVR